MTDYPPTETILEAIANTLDPPEGCDLCVIVEGEVLPPQFYMMTKVLSRGHVEYDPPRMVWQLLTTKPVGRHATRTQIICVPKRPE